MTGADGVGAQGPVGTTQPTPNIDPPPPPRDEAAHKADTAASPESSPHSVTGESDLFFDAFLGRMEVIVFPLSGVLTVASSRGGGGGSTFGTGTP